MKTPIFIFSAMISVLPFTICEADVSIGISKSIYHSSGSNGIFFEYRQSRIGGSIHYWTGSKSQNEKNNLAVSVDYAMPLTENFEFIGGLCSLNRKSKQTGTYLNACVGIEWTSEKYFIRFWHASHGASFGISRDKANSGYNFIIIGKKF